MNDLNLLVSHALSAVRDAQQSVRDGDMAAGDEAPPLLANFADVMQGLIALAQTAPQTEDAFDYAKTALLQKLAKDKAEGDGLPIDVSATQDVENEDGAAEMLLEEDEATEAGEQSAPSPLAAAFAPLQETIASLLMAHAPAVGGAGSEAADAVVAHVMQAAGRLPQPVKPDTQIAQPGVEDVAAQPSAQAAADAQGRAAADAAQQVADAQSKTLQQIHAPQMNDVGGNGQRGSADTDGAQAQPSQQADPQRNPMQGSDTPSALDAAPFAEQSGLQPAARGAEGLSSATAQQSAQPVALPADSVAFTAQTLPTPQDLANAPVLQDGADTASAASGQAPQAQPASAATQAAGPQVAARDLQSKAQTEMQATDAADVQPVQAGAIEIAAPTKTASERSRGDVARTNAAAASRAGDGGQGNVRPSSTIAERQAARHMQNYQQAMSDQIAAPAPAAAAVTPAEAGAAATHFVPAPAAAVTPAVDATAPHTVQLPAVALPDLPADLSNALAAGAKRVRIEINPPSLGNVEVGVHMRDGAVFVSMQAENANVAQHIERHIQDLRAHLKDAGLSLGGFEMSARGDEANHNAPHSGNASQERLWSDDMLKLATDGGAGRPIEEIPTPVLSNLRPGSINVVA